MKQHLKIFSFSPTVDYKIEMLMGLTIALMVLLPRLVKAVPSSLVAIMVVFTIVVGFNIDTRTVGDIASISWGFPPFQIPVVPFTLETLNIIFPYAAIMAGVGLIEYLLALNLMDQIAETRGNGNRECLAQGGGKILSGLFFKSVTAFDEKFDVLNVSKEVILDFRESRTADMSAIEAVDVLTERYDKQEKKLHLRNQSDSSQRKLLNADALIDVNILEHTFERVTDKFCEKLYMIFQPAEPPNLVKDTRLKLPGVRHGAAIPVISCL